MQLHVIILLHLFQTVAFSSSTFVTPTARTGVANHRMLSVGLSEQILKMIRVVECSCLSEILGVNMLVTLIIHHIFCFVTKVH